ncbi:MAG: hypothetical protein ACRCZF_03935, partial [Gemmataceae bacterium]
MWTPRRMLLFLVGLIGLAGAYTGYSAVLGSLDGFPQLPDHLLARLNDDDIAPIPIERISPTDARLMEAFGPNCPEKSYTQYPTKIELREDGIVFAAGRPQWDKEPSRYVKLSPFSMAVFGKQRLGAENNPGEAQEISTIHADIAELEFDKPIGSEKDMMSGKAKLIGVVLRHDPTPFSSDRRTGRITITNNQRQTDPARQLVFVTQGPVYYRVPEQTAAAAPHIWTTAAVQIENRENMPRPLRQTSLPAVPLREESATGPTIAEMIAGSYTPPPTITADGMKIYLKPAPAAPANAPGNKKSKGPAYSGVRFIELSDNVVMNLWVDGKSGFPGAADRKPASSPAGNTSAAPGDPTLGALAVAGGAVDAATIAQRLTKKALVRIRTLGPFRYDYETSVARFEVAARTDPNVPNNVEVTRLNALGQRDY